VKADSKCPKELNVRCVIMKILVKHIHSVWILVIFTNSKNGKMKPKSPILLNILDTLKKNLKVKLITIIDVIVMDFLKVVGKILDILKLWVVGNVEGRMLGLLL
jgi:hypothetical protein